jgi:class 3 adenylate cyclase
LVRIEPDQIREWTSLGLLDPDGHGAYDDLDLLRLMTIRHYSALDYSPERLAEEISSGKLSPFLGEFIYPRGDQLTVDQAVASAGMEPDLLHDLRTALGYTRATFSERDLATLQGFSAIGAAGVPREAMLEGARVFGDSLRRLAETLIRLVHVHIHERLLDEGLTEEEVTRRIDALQDAALPLLDGMVRTVFHEHFLQASIEDAYVHLVDTEAGVGRGSVEATIVFIDVESFTKLTETEGDQAAIELMTRVDALVRPLALEHEGKVVKHIGDALMLAFRDSADAVDFAAQLHDAAGHDATLPGLRVGMHCGPAVYRGGDYIGSTVNLASRVTSTATAGRTVVTETVARALGDGAPLEPVGVRMLRGSEHPVALYRLRRRVERRDPSCGRMVADPPAARLMQGDEELWFCSEECLRNYLSAAPSAA